jgi:hypothetical protein
MILLFVGRIFNPSGEAGRIENPSYDGTRLSGACTRLCGQHPGGVGKLRAAFSAIFGKE